MVYQRRGHANSRVFFKQVDFIAEIVEKSFETGYLPVCGGGSQPLPLIGAPLIIHPFASQVNNIVVDIHFGDVPDKFQPDVSDWDFIEWHIRRRSASVSQHEAEKCLQVRIVFTDGGIGMVQVGFKILKEVLYQRRRFFIKKKHVHTSNQSFLAGCFRSMGFSSANQSSTRCWASFRDRKTVRPRSKME